MTSYKQGMHATSLIYTIIFGALIVFGLLPAPAAMADNMGGALVPDFSATPVDASAQSPPMSQDKVVQNSSAQDQEDQSVLATIIQSHSTNSRGYQLSIYKDGSATAEISNAGIPQSGPSQRQQFPPGTVDTKTLQGLLEHIGDVRKIPIGFCAKSVSFGTHTQIMYANKSSGDLQCIGQASDGDQTILTASQDLGKFVRTLLQHLNINTRRVISAP